MESDVADNPLRDELLANPLVPIDGFITVPDGPGPGIALGPEAVQRFSAEL